ncbi:Serine/threonine-protein kinase spk-1 [Beauveria bassiana]|nr:Serine/threonine-protein kinase spk-1 [Beauveria bassiana]
MLPRGYFALQRASQCISLASLISPALRLGPPDARPPFSSRQRPPLRRNYSALVDDGFVDRVERLDKYTPGGFHPVLVGDRIHNRYEVIDKLGYGGWSTVWLVHDSHMQRYLALKVGIADSLPREVPILRALSAQPKAQNLGFDSIPHLLDEFTVSGPNGSHPCYTTALALCNLRECSSSRLFYLDVARAMAYELVLAVAYVHSQNFVHGVHSQSSIDKVSIPQFRKEYGEPESYKVERRDGQPLTPNVPSIVTVPLYMGKKAKEFTLRDARIILSDFGESYSPGTDVRLGKNCHTPVDFRPPEAHFEPDTPLSFSADIWSLATAIWDIVGMRALFSSAFYSDKQVMCQIVDIIGPLPDHWYENWKDRDEFFDRDGQPKESRHVWPEIGQAFRNRVQKFRGEANMVELCVEEEAAFLDMMKRMLKYRPEERYTVQQVLECDWMVKWARSNFERSRLSQA